MIAPLPYELQQRSSSHSKTTSSRSPLPTAADTEPQGSMAQRLRAKAENVVLQHPAVIVATSVFFGMGVGWVVKRKIFK